ncbi:MAG: hypothetical protein QMD82_04610 [bacterium]|nr:hypothetical protein [bacterium]
MLIILVLTNHLFINAIKSRNFVVYYQKDSINAVKICNFLEQNRNNILKTTGGNPPTPHIFIEDIGTISNGYSDPVSRSISIFNYVPGPDFHFGTMKSWWRTVSVHEYTHHTQLSNIGFPANIFRLFFGKIYLPNMLFLPSYMQEGIAVYNESNLDPKDGRLNEGYFDAYLKILNARRKLRQGVYLNHDPVDYPQGEIVYLMGSEFTEFLIKDYGEQKLKKYYTTVGRMPFTIPLIDIPAIIAYKKPLSSLWKRWQRKLKFQRGFYPLSKSYIDRGYHIKYLRSFGRKVYYVKTNYKRVSWEHNYYESDLCVFDPTPWKIDKIYTGDISLPPVIAENSIYLGIPDVKKGNANISYYGIYFTNAIVKIDSSGKFNYLFNGRIRAFDVSRDTIFYVIDEIEGSSLWKFWNGKHEKIAYFDNLKIQQVSLDDNSFYFLAHKDLEGNQIFRLSKEKLEKITDLPFEIGYFQKTGNNLLFPGNFNGKWSLFLFDIGNGKLKIFDEPVLAYYPALDPETVYYVTIDIDGEYLCTSSLRNFKDFELDFETKQNTSLDQENSPLREVEKVSNFAYLKELAYPDLILPVLTFNMNYLPDLKSAKITFEGIQFQGHSPLNLLEYAGTVYFSSPRSSQLITFYNGIPATSIAFSLSGNKNYFGFGVGHILYIKKYGYLRQMNLYGESFPWASQFSFSSVVLTKINPDVYQTHSIGIHFSNKDIVTSLYHLTRFPIVRTLLLQGEVGIKHLYPSNEIEHAEDIRLTLPFIRFNWGNDAVIHFFYERNFLSLEFLNTKTRNFTGSGIIFSMDHLMSLINGNFKIVLRTGFMKKFGEPAPYIFITFEPTSVNFSHGIFRKRWLLREISGVANLL